MLSVSTQFTPTDDVVQFEKMLESVDFADEILVFAYKGSDSAYLTRLSAKYPIRVVPVGYPAVVEAIRADQVRKSSGEWVLVMDFDEVVTPELEQEIRYVIKSGPAVYAVKRRNYSLGYPLRYGGWGDDYVPRLFHRDVFVDWPTDIHATPLVKGEIQKLQCYMEHHKDKSLAYIVSKTNRYSGVEAEQFYRGNLPEVTAFTLMRKSGMEFFRRYIMKKGFLDGKIGLIQSIYQGFSVFITYAKLFELQNQKTDSGRKLPIDRKQPK